MRYYRIGMRNKHKEIIAYTFVDKQDYEKYKNVRFTLEDGFATRNKKRLHRLILHDAPSDKIVYHLNGNKLDNRRANLKIAESGKEYYYFLKNLKSKNLF